MKRTAILFLALALLLAACSGLSVQGPNEASLSTTAPFSVSTQPTTEPLSESAAEPSTEAVKPEPDPDSGEDPDWMEPEPPEEPEEPDEPIDWTVHTDRTAYAPKYTRLREGPLDRFEPSEDYGLVFPYVAAVQTVYDGDHPETQLTYGLADRNGRILTDGIYDHVERVEILDPEYRAYWLVSQLMDWDVFRERFPDFKHSGEDVELPRVYGLISVDGSIALDCAYPRLQRIGDAFLCNNGGGGFDFTVRSADLEPLFTGAEVFGDMACDMWELECREGLFLVSTADILYHSDSWYDFELVNRAEWFCDETGARVLGPYVNASPFREGLACASPDGEHYGYIGKTGAWVIRPEYDWYDWDTGFVDGVAFLYTEDGSLAVLDRTGRELLRRGKETADLWAEIADCGFAVITEVRIGDDRFQYRDYYDWEGKLLASGDGSLRCLNETTFWNYAPEARLLRIFTPERSLLTLELEPEVDGYWSYNDLLREGVYLRGGDLLMGWYVSQQYSGEPEYFIPSDCSEVIEVEPPTSPEPHYSYYNNSYVRDALTWEGWQFCWTGTAWEGRTEAGERCEIPLPAVVIRPMGELILAFTENATCLLTRDGEIVFCRPFDTGD